jgi:hypothetical protein
VHTPDDQVEDDQIETGTLWKYGWLTRIVAVAIGERVADGPVYQVFEVL